VRGQDGDGADRSLRRRLLGSSLVRTVLSVWSWFVLGVLVALWIPMVAAVRLATARSDPGRYRAGLLWRKLAVAHQRLNPLWTFHVTGTPPEDPRRPYVVVSNHESFVDILLIAHLPFEMKWLSKETFFKFPGVGWLMRMAGDVPLRRGDRESVVEALRQCRARLDQRVSVMVFPEGTRSRTGELGAFKDGAFSLAIDAQVPVLPLAVHGARGALRSHDWRFGLATAEVRILEPISTEGMTAADVPVLRERVRDRIAAELADMATTTR
jgi:1-acyl-sn-glycerol-3-phosphate acyltransferase